MKPEVTAETNLNVAKKTRATSVPKDAGRILQGVLKLPLRDRVEVRDALTTSIDNEITQMGEEYAEAKKLINGQQ